MYIVSWKFDIEIVVVLWCFILGGIKLERLDQYWYLLQNVFLLLSFINTLFLILMIKLNRKNEKGSTFILGIGAIGVGLAVYFLSFFYGVLVDEFNLETNPLVIGSALYSAGLFVSQMILFVTALVRKR